MAKKKTNNSKKKKQIEEPSSRKIQRRIARAIAVVLFVTHLVFAFRFCAEDGFSYGLAFEYVLHLLPASIIFMFTAIILEIIARATDILAVGFVAAVVASGFAQIFGETQLALILLIVIGVLSIIANVIRWIFRDKNFANL